MLKALIHITKCLPKMCEHVLPPPVYQIFTLLYPYYSFINMTLKDLPLSRCCRDLSHLFAQQCVSVILDMVLILKLPLEQYVI